MIEGLRKISEEVAVNYPGVEIYNLKLSKLHSDYYIQIELDNLNDPFGSVTVDICENFSKDFIQSLDERLTSDKIAFNLPIDLEVDNYTLEVSSAGAEREIRLPNDLERFKNLPLKIQFNDSIKEKDQQIIARFISVENDDYVFEEYITKKQKKSVKIKTKANVIKLKQENIKKINLYLDI